MSRNLTIFFLPLILGMMLSLSVGDLAQAMGFQTVNAPQKTVWSGVYTEAEAERGQSIYDANCKGCHGPSLEGLTANPPLKGPRFFEKWREDNLNTLFTRMRASMPRRDPGSLSDREYLDIVAYILKSNDHPAGNSELSTGALRTIQIEGKDGPQPLLNQAFVMVVGCLTQADEDNWMLAMSPLPRRTGDTDKTTPEEIKDAMTRAPGNLTFRLQNLDMLGDFRPEGNRGHKMLAKGLLIKQASGDRISLTTMEDVSASCP